MIYIIVKGYERETFKKYCYDEVLMLLLFLMQLLIIMHKNNDFDLKTIYELMMYVSYSK